MSYPACCLASVGNQALPLYGHFSENPVTLLRAPGEMSALLMSLLANCTSRAPLTLDM